MLCVGPARAARISKESASSEHWKALGGDARPPPLLCLSRRDVSGLYVQHQPLSAAEAPCIYLYTYIATLMRQYLAHTSTPRRVTPLLCLCACGILFAYCYIAATNSVSVCNPIVSRLKHHRWNLVRIYQNLLYSWKTIGHLDMFAGCANYHVV